MSTLEGSFCCAPRFGHTPLPHYVRKRILHCCMSCRVQDNEAWLVMDFVGGGSVSDILEACEVTLSEAEAKECTAWTVLALDYLHSNRKLHRVRTA